MLVVYLIPLVLVMQILFTLLVARRVSLSSYMKGYNDGQSDLKDNITDLTGRSKVISVANTNDMKQLFPSLHNAICTYNNELVDYAIALQDLMNRANAKQAMKIQKEIENNQFPIEPNDLISAFHGMISSLFVDDDCGFGFYVTLPVTVNSHGVETHETWTYFIGSNIQTKDV